MLEHPLVRDDEVRRHQPCGRLVSTAANKTDRTRIERVGIPMDCRVVSPWVALMRRRQRDLEGLRDTGDRSELLAPVAEQRGEQLEIDEPVADQGARQGVGVVGAGPLDREDLAA